MEVLFEVREEDLKPGEFYIVRLGDCCIDGELFMRFQGRDEFELRFNFGTLTNWSAVTFWQPKHVDKLEALELETGQRVEIRGETL